MRWGDAGRLKNIKGLIANNNMKLCTLSYKLFKVVGLFVHGLSQPKQSGWHWPRQCAPPGSPTTVLLLVIELHFSTKSTTPQQCEFMFNNCKGDVWDAFSNNPFKRYESWVIHNLDMRNVSVSTLAIHCWISLTFLCGVISTILEITTKQGHSLLVVEAHAVECFMKVSLPCCYLGARHLHKEGSAYVWSFPGLNNCLKISAFLSKMIMCHKSRLCFKV